MKRCFQKFRARLCRLLGCRQQTKGRVWLLETGPDEPIPNTKTKAKNMKLSKPIKPGFRRPFTITPDEAVDVRADGNFFAADVVEGDSTVTYNPESTAQLLKGWFNGDGATGNKQVRIKADGHVGEGEQEVTLDVEYLVATPDATSLAALVEGVDEPIPTEPSPA